MKIDLYCQDSVMIIIKYPTGITYDIQCGGLACYHHTVEGFILDSYPSIRQSLEMTTYGAVLKDEDAKKVDNAISQINGGCHGIKISSWYRERSMEAYVECAVEYQGQIFNAVLTWENCD